MKTRTSFTKVVMIIGAATLALGTVWEVRRVYAFNPQPDPPGFGIVGITRNETLRINIVNLALADRELPPDPCRVVLSFRDAQGHPLTNGDNQVIRRAVDLQAGESAFLDLNGNQFGPGDTTLPTRVQLRPFVRVVEGPRPGIGGTPPDPCFPTMEVFDNSTGRTTLFAAATLRFVDEAR